MLPALLDAVDAGAELEAWEMPTNLDRRPGGAPFKPADVLEFHQLLLEPDWFDEIRRCELDSER
jgi:hypothetical protein